MGERIEKALRLLAQSFHMTRKAARGRRDELEMVTGVLTVSLHAGDARQQGMGPGALEGTPDVLGNVPGRRCPCIRLVKKSLPVEALGRDSQHVGDEESGVDPFECGDGVVESLLPVECAAG